jgi:hypothetical protein
MFSLWDFFVTATEPIVIYFSGLIEFVNFEPRFDVALVMEVFHVFGPDINLRIINGDLRNGHFVAPGLHVRHRRIEEDVFLEVVLDRIELVHVQQHLWVDESRVNCGFVQLGELLIRVAIGVVAPHNPYY